jgi:endonuclease/exonuclease/phosphatase family metal-dependent hydrolase
MPLRRPIALAAALAALTLAACGDDDDDGGGGGFVYQDDGQLQVMTRNLYLGADLFPLLTATPDEFVALANSVIESVMETNDFAVRAAGIANEIAAARPDLVGLQEVSLWRTQFPGDGTATPATAVVLDFLALLQNELAARGLPYVVAEEIDLFDLEVPVPIGTTTPTDVRLTDRQVILAIQGLPTRLPSSGVGSGVFTTLAEPTVLGTTLPILRGWTAVETTVGGKQIAFYNTHLEAFDPPDFRIAQAGELAALLDADLLSTVAQVLVGDLNSLPGTEGHLAITNAGFSDLWAEAGTGAGLTCCFDADLTVSTATLDQRIDYVLWRGALAPASGAPPVIVGDEAGDRIGNPQRWPSDHAGVVGTFDP